MPLTPPSENPDASFIGSDPSMFELDGTTGFERYEVTDYLPGEVLTVLGAFEIDGIDLDGNTFDFKFTPAEDEDDLVLSAEEEEEIDGILGGDLEVFDDSFTPDEALGFYTLLMMSSLAAAATS